MVFPAVAIPEIDPVRTLGRPRIMSASALSTGAGETVCRLRLGTGRRVYHIVAAWGYQSSGGARTVFWSCFDGVSMSRVQSIVNWPSDQYLFLNYNRRTLSELVPGSDTTRYWRFSWTALGAGENGYLRAIVLQTDVGVR